MRCYLTFSVVCFILFSNLNVINKKKYCNGFTIIFRKYPQNPLTSQRKRITCVIYSQRFDSKIPMSLKSIITTYLMHDSLNIIYVTWKLQVNELIAFRNELQVTKTLAVFENRKVKWVPICEVTLYFLWIKPTHALQMSSDNHYRNMISDKETEMTKMN